MASELPGTAIQVPSRPRRPSPDSEPSLGHPKPSMMAYNCQPCVRRKVKCDRKTPTCSSCVKSKQDCFYQAPPKPRRKKRKGDGGEGDAPEEDVHDRLARYERILRRNGLLDDDGNTTPAPADKEALSSRVQGLLLPQVDTTAPRSLGKLLSGGGKSRYIESNLWLDTDAGDEMYDLSDDAEGPRELPTGLSSMTFGYDPVTGTLLGHSQDLLELHPSHEHAVKLWAAHVQNVEPLCRILHIQTTAKMVDAVSRQPSTATRTQECQLFAIYHLAVYSMDEEDCQRGFGQSRGALLAKYEHAMWQALVNASWLKTTEMPVMQAIVLLLICGRSYMDPHTFWMLTGIGVRIAQRMGLHRDGESLGLPPFEVQMRRRLFWQLLPLDGFAGQHSGTGISLPPNSWDVKKPLNVGDDQIYPGMTQLPEVQEGATDMLYVLTRVELSEFYSRKAVRMRDGLGPSLDLKPSSRYIDQVERKIEAKYLRYCDIINPVHYLVTILVRSAANLVRLRCRLAQLKDHTIDDVERRALYGLAQKIMDSDNAISRHWDLRRFRWQVKDSFLWDALICMVTSLAQPGFFTRCELDSTWARMADVWEHHPELLSSGRPGQLSAGKAILEAWAANPPSNADPEPVFITTLRAKRSKAKKALASGGDGGGVGCQGSPEGTSRLDGGFGSWDMNGLEGIDGGIASPAVGDWVFWDQFFLNAGP